jgi:hypothetical protein
MGRWMYSIIFTWHKIEKWLYLNSQPQPWTWYVTPPADPSEPYSVDLIYVTAELLTLFF